jgi:hypothetical protein
VELVEDVGLGDQRAARVAQTIELRGDERDAADHRDQPERRPRAIVSAQERGSYVGSAFVPASAAIADQFVLDASDEDRALPAAPRGAPAARSRAWLLFDDCP